jgi:hypothetical protein
MTAKPRQPAKKAPAKKAPAKKAPAKAAEPEILSADVIDQAAPDLNAPLPGATDGSAPAEPVNDSEHTQAELVRSGLDQLAMSLVGTPQSVTGDQIATLADNAAPDESEGE